MENIVRAWVRQNAIYSDLVDVKVPDEFELFMCKPIASETVIMNGISDQLMSDALSLLSKYSPGSDFEDPVSLLQQNLQIETACALALADLLERKFIWSPLIDGKRFLARDLWLHLPDDIWNSDTPPRIEFIDAIAREK